MAPFAGFGVYFSVAFAIGAYVLSFQLLTLDLKAETRHFRFFGTFPLRGLHDLVFCS
jgi:hypothetical protein